jgi:hypothetical protein
MFRVEFSSMLRAPSHVQPSLNLDEFTDGFVADLTSAIEVPVAPFAFQSSDLHQRLSAAIDDQTRPMTAAISGRRSCTASRKDRLVEELELIQRELESLRAAFKSNVDLLIGEFEKERSTTVALQEADESRAWALEQRLREAKWAQIELEARFTQQNIEKEGHDRLLKQFIERRRNWEYESPEADEWVTLKQKILEEIRFIRQNVRRGALEELFRVIEDGVHVMRNENENMRTELTELEVANRWILTRVHRSSVPPVATRRQKSSLVAEAHVRVDYLRQRRQNSVIETLQ